MNRGFGIPATADPDRAARVAVAVEHLGFAGVWSNDTPGADGLVTASRMAAASGHIRVAVGVVAVDRRPPEQITATLASLSLPQERFVLGIGAGGSGKPVSAVRSAISELRAALGPGVRIGIAAMGPRMCRLAGEEADLVLFNWMLPERIRWAVDRVAEGKRNRSTPGPGLAAYVRVAIGPGAAERIAAEAAKYNTFPAYARHFQAQGAPLETLGVVAGEPDTEPRLKKYHELLDEVVIRALPGSDSVESTLAVAEATAPGKG
jgi:alkanesulfonate monooxygenase SsuD/methylene tetrahydromethanopterin reductase-like flavin-dependent oxidoreductase (luciferase family)